MKTAGKVMLGFIVLYIGFAAVFYSIIQIQKWKVRHHANQYFSKLVANSPSTESEQLVSFHRIRAEYDDGCVCLGHVQLTYRDHGQLVSYPAVFTLNNRFEVKEVTRLR
ncbi:hypothetical protein ACFPYJ_24640 [Paenibacillus solisilvae]|uniref:DUF3301 domain-containing protein n=1 Tax=Paenibacillus solisilvae TaxID=2486751 RepID=A0ABW0W251_9BACL